MARTARKPKDDDGGEVKTKDFALAIKLYRHDINPALSKVGEYNQEAATAYKAIKKSCHIQPQAAKLAFKLDGMEEAKRDDFLRCFTGLLTELNIPLQSNDLVDQMEDKDDAGKAPSGPAAVVSRPKPKLVTIPSDGTETDLADAAFEASDEELAKQEGRGKPTPGTGAAAIEAMKAAAAAAGEDEGIEG